LDKVAAELKAAQDKAASLFNDVVKAGLITPGKLESELTQDIYNMARDRYEVKRHWHKRVVRGAWYRNVPKPWARRRKVDQSLARVAAAS
jgi:hypothetical protein